MRGGFKLNYTELLIADYRSSVQLRAPFIRQLSHHSMQNFLEQYEAAKKAVHPDKILVAGMIALLSVPVIVPLQAYLTFLTHEVGENISPEWIQILAVAIIGLANIVSVALETKVLDEKGYSASPMSSIFKVFIKNSMGIASAGHAINFSQMYIANPVQLLNFLSLQAGGGNRLFFENAVGVTLALSLWKLVFNGAILYFDIEVLKVPAKKISQRLKSKQDVSIMHDIDLLQ